MRLPRSQKLSKSGYRIGRQTGSHLRLTTTQHGEHHITIPQRTALRLGTLAGILTDIAERFDLTRDDIAMRLFGDTD